MRTLLRPAFTLLALFSLLTGLVYPLVVTGAAQAMFPSQANGSVLVRNGQAIGSSLIGQPFDEPRYFWGRPSATLPFPYNASASMGSNLGPSSPALKEAVRQRIARLRAADPASASLAVPIDLVTASASGLDPDISPGAAYYQAHRVALARGLAEEKVRTLIASLIEARAFGLLGEPRVNVLRLNLALDALVGTGS